MPTSAVVLRVIPLALALLQTALVLVVLHVPVSCAMRARGLASWRGRDTLLTVPLLAVALAVAFGALNHGIARAAWDASHGHAAWTAPATALAVAAGALVVAAFGARAVAKLY